MLPTKPIGIDMGIAHQFVEIVSDINYSMLLNAAAVGFGAYVCYAIFKHVKKTGRSIKRNVGYWTQMVSVILNALAFITNYIERL